MRTLMLKRFEALVRRSAFVVGIVLDEEENKTEIMLDPVRASRSHPHTQNPFHTSGAQRMAAAHVLLPLHLLFILFCFCFSGSGVRKSLGRSRCQAHRSGGC